MAFEIRVFVNEQFVPAGPKLAIQPVNAELDVHGEFTDIHFMQFDLGWKEGDRARRSTAGPANLRIYRQLDNSDRDVLADTLLAGPSQRGDPYVVPLRMYEIDSETPGWSGVVNEWQFGRAIVTSSRIDSAEGSQAVDLICTDVQMIPRRGVLPPCPRAKLQDKLFLNK